MSTFRYKFEKILTVREKGKADAQAKYGEAVNKFEEIANKLYKLLKKKWKVSIAAMIRRAEKLGVMTTEEYQNLIRIMQRRGQRKEERAGTHQETARGARKTPARAG